MPVSEQDLRQLAELCTLCGLCPCPRIPMAVMEAKSCYVDDQGLPLTTRLLSDVPRLARLCGTFPRITAAFQASPTLGSLLNRVAGLHPQRRLPAFARESFFHWAEQKGLTRRPGEGRVAYFAGCTAGYLFPGIGRALVEVLERNGLRVFVPSQECCGMPHLVEGDRGATLQRAGANLQHLLAAAAAGDDLVTSCPTCGFFLQELLKERAVYSEAQAGADELKVPDPNAGEAGHRVLKKSMYQEILKDDGYFSSLDPLKRIDLAGRLTDAGAYLARLHGEGRLDTTFQPLPQRLVYFAPCHQREQKMGDPISTCWDWCPVCRSRRWARVNAATWGAISASRPVFTRNRWPSAGLCWKKSAGSIRRGSSPTA